MKNIILILTILCSIGMYAQVGINNTDPKASLDVSRSTVATEADGVLVPRATVAQLEAKNSEYGTDQNGALVFVTSSGTGTTAKTTNIDGEGFYYYDASNSVWLAVGGAETLSFRDNVTTETLTAADLNGVVIVTQTPANPFDLSTLSSSANPGDTITFAAYDNFVVSNNDLRAGSNTAPGNTGDGLVYLWTGTDWIQIQRQ